GGELRGQRLVGGEDEGGPARLGDDVGYRETLARAGDAEQGLELVAPGHALDERVDRLGLITRGRHLGDELEFRHRRIVPTPYDSYVVPMRLWPTTCVGL